MAENILGRASGRIAARRGIQKRAQVFARWSPRAFARFRIAPVGCEHRMGNPGRIDLELIEGRSGSHLGEDGVIRLENYPQARVRRAPRAAGAINAPVDTGCAGAGSKADTATRAPPPARRQGSRRQFGSKQDDRVLVRGWQRSGAPSRAFPDGPLSAIRLGMEGGASGLVSLFAARAANAPAVMFPSFSGMGGNEKINMTAIESTAFQRLEAEGRLLKPALKAPTHRAGRFGFRGEIAVTLDPPVNLEAAFASAEEGEAALSFLAGSLRPTSSCRRSSKR